MIVWCIYIVFTHVSRCVVSLPGNPFQKPCLSHCDACLRLCGDCRRRRRCALSRCCWCLRSPPGSAPGDDATPRSAASNRPPLVTASSGTECHAGNSLCRRHRASMQRHCSKRGRRQRPLRRHERLQLFFVAQLRWWIILGRRLRPACRHIKLCCCLLLH